MKCSIQCASHVRYKNTALFSVNLIKKDTKVKKVAHYFERLPMHPLHLFGNYSTFSCYWYHVNIIIIISIQPEGQFWQEPEPSQATGVALAHCVPGSFLGVGCHCFPPPLDVPTFASRCLHVQATWETSISERRNYGREMAGQFSLWFRLPRKPRVLWHAAQICDMGDGFTSPPRKACCGFFSPEKSNGFGRDRTRDLGYQRPAC